MEAGLDTPLKCPLRLSQQSPVGHPFSGSCSTSMTFCGRRHKSRDLASSMRGREYPGGRGFGRLHGELSGPFSPSTPREEEEYVTQRFRRGAAIFWRIFYFTVFLSRYPDHPITTSAPLKDPKNADFALLYLLLPFGGSQEIIEDVNTVFICFTFIAKPNLAEKLFLFISVRTYTYISIYQPAADVGQEFPYRQRCRLVC